MDLTEKKLQLYESVLNDGFVHDTIDHEEDYYAISPNTIEKEKQDSKEQKEKTNTRSNECDLSYNKIFAVVTFSCANFTAGACYSILGPFYPQEAMTKGMNAMLTGLVIGWFELMAILTSPLFGSFLTEIGGKFMYVSGLCVAGTSAGLFGILEYCPGGVTYVVMCFLVRTVQGVGNNAFHIASYSIIANTFPEKVASMIGSLSMFYAVGLLVGPSLGGVLYHVGGFKLPFMTMGFITIVIGFTSIFVLKVPEDIVITQKKKSFLFLIKEPKVLIMILVVVSCAACVGFIDVGLAIQLSQQYKLSPLHIGLIFLIGPSMYGLTIPVFGHIADKYTNYSLIFVLFGNLVTGISFIFMGPSPFIPIEGNLLWLQLLTLAGVGFGSGVILFFYRIVLNVAIDMGMTENLETYGLISGLFTLFYSTGIFLGPIAAGYLLDISNFQWTAFAFGCLLMFCALSVSMYMTVKCIFSKYAKTTSYSDNGTSLELKETSILTEAASTDTSYNSIHK